MPLKAKRLKGKRRGNSRNCQKRRSGNCGGAQNSCGKRKAGAGRGGRCEKITKETRKREEAVTMHKADMAAMDARNAEALAELDRDESRARAQKCRNEAAEADVRRRKMKYGTHGAF